MTGNRSSRWQHARSRALPQISAHSSLESLEPGRGPTHDARGVRGSKATEGPRRIDPRVDSHCTPRGEPHAWGFPPGVRRRPQWESQPGGPADDLQTSWRSPGAWAAPVPTSIPTRGAAEQRGVGRGNRSEGSGGSAADVVWLLGFATARCRCPIPTRQSPSERGDEKQTSDGDTCPIPMRRSQGERATRSGRTRRDQHSQEGRGPTTGSAVWD